MLVAFRQNENTAVKPIRKVAVPPPRFIAFPF
jgi:hypothetical protein